MRANSGRRRPNFLTEKTGRWKRVRETRLRRTATLTLTIDTAHQPVAPAEFMLLCWKMRVINPILVAQLFSLTLLAGFLEASRFFCTRLRTPNDDPQIRI